MALISEKQRDALVLWFFRLLLGLCGGFLLFMLVGKLIVWVWGAEKVIAHSGLFSFVVIMAGVIGWMIGNYIVLRSWRKTDVEIAEIERKIEKLRRT